MVRLRFPSMRHFGYVVLLLAAGIGCKSQVDDGETQSQGGQGGATSVSDGTNSGGTGAQSTDTSHTTGGTSSEALIDDFEDGDGTPLIGFSWYGYNDQSNGGGSVLTFPGATGSAVVTAGEGYQSTHSLQADYSFDQGTLTYAPFVGVGVSLGNKSAPYDMTQYNAISYTYKGGAHRVQLQTYEITDYDYFGTAVTASTEWKPVTLPLTLFTQEGWGIASTLNPANIDSITFALRGATGDKGTIQIDNLKLVQMPKSTTPDMVVNPATFPADQVIDPITITNPLQAKAEAYLSRGYNITNWLEQGRFKTFTYDEAWVKRLAAAGFKSLRLPIDLDLYIESASGTGDAMELTLSSDLFTILDSFDTWTKSAGISLTIDYHQYDKSILLSDADSLTKAVKVWGKVAEHFAANTREDLFFELLNEPDLSMGGTAPTQAQMTEFAERMITAIRAYDTTHTLIFGDVKWYSIDTLSKRKLLSDSNVIYAFHTYDPFIFTHQGASWANMGATHDLPYPYDPARWSGFYADLGFSPLAEAWILAAAQSYYINGSRSAIRNHILAAKRWAVTNNVPVICNEFGAYEGTSKLEDRVRYYTDMVSIFDELKIPWQAWFMLMDATGTVIPEYRTAFKLDQ